MSEARLRIARAGVGASVQDGGRRGYRRYGVPVSGPIDWVAHRLALSMVGDDPDGPALEFGPGGLVVEGEGAPVTVGVAGGGASARWHRTGGAIAVLAAPFRVGLAAGERLVARPGPGGWGALAARGLRVDPVLGSRATAVRAGLGPPVPTEGTRYPCDPTGLAWPELFLDPVEAVPSDAPLRVLPGPQTHLFEDAAVARLVSEPFAVTPARDRMGVRLDGPPLRAPGGHDIVSDGLVEGAMQVPGDGRPIVLMADRAPTGGYPKIAVLARADLPRLARAAPGTALRFEWIAPDAARAAATALDAAVRDPEPRRRTPHSQAWLQRALRGR